jgi:hypothetical protein
MQTGSNDRIGFSLDNGIKKMLAKFIGFSFRIGGFQDARTNLRA